MKSLACGDVVPPGRTRWVCDTEDDAHAEISRHAAADYGLTLVPAELADAVRAQPRVIAAFDHATVSTSLRTHWAQPCSARRIDNCSGR